jgi:hypothetical protein
MPSDHQKYEAANVRNIRRVNARIKAIYADAIQELTVIAASLPYRGGTIALADYPTLQDRVNRIIERVNASIFTTVVNGITTGWDLANEKNDGIVDRRLAGKTPTETARQVLYDPNAGALKQFIERKEKGLNLSQRVYKNLELFGPEMERGLLLGISQGDSAASMTQDIKQYLKYPDKVFRRIRDAEGKLQLSKAAQDFHPGQGVYRSSYKNALRLGGTETNIAYRKSDNTRWEKLPFVVGIDIHTSANHPEYDICDELKGAYPKDFVFTGWHPQCICYQTPRMLTDAEYSKYEDQILGIGTFDDEPSNKITEPPAGFNKFLEDNKDRINGWKNTPYWVKDNPAYASALNK